MHLSTAAMIACVLLLATQLFGQSFAPLKSPDGAIVVEFRLVDGRPTYSILRNGQPALQESRLGLIRDDEDFSRGLKLVSQSPANPVEDRYEILTAKRRVNTYHGNASTIHLQTASGKKMHIMFQVSNDGVAFRYVFPELSSNLYKLKEDASSFHFLPGTVAWLQPMQVAKSGWQATNPAYEEYYAREIPVGTPSSLGVGWVYPALFRSGETWLLLSEGTLARNFCATHLHHDSPDGEYGIALADQREIFNAGPALPQSTLPWTTPWRIIAIGSLKTISESTLGIDLADKPTVTLNPNIKPGKASWSWPLLGDNQTTFPVQKRFIDYAAEMGWSYCLIDALWDTKIGYDRIKELADYAATKNVGLLLWYNSNGKENTAPQTPKDLMNTHETRIAEFEKLKSMGIKGLKIDFFAGDGQSVISYYHDILEDAALYGLLVNFHGATLPRGWQRTYPHLMTAEAIKGLEYITFEQKNANEEPTHAATIPFTRNVFDPMDFTPVALDRINARIQRRTTPAFELALSVLFTSGIQHYAEIPEGMARQPEYVKQFMKDVPSIWDDTKFIAGYPGKFVVMARKANNKWYLCGINAESAEMNLTLNLAELGVTRGTLITDGEQSGSFKTQAIKLNAQSSIDIRMNATGGIVMTLE